MGTQVQIEGDGFTDPTRWWTGGYGISLIGLGPSDCELIAQATSYTMRVDKTGHMAGSFVVPAQGGCFQAGTPAPQPVQPGRYTIVLGCHACFVARFRVTRKTPSLEQEQSLFGFGRLPAALSGNVWALICPMGTPLVRPTSSLVARAASRLLEDADGPRPRPPAVWRLMDGILHRLMEPKVVFVRAMRTIRVGRVWSAWRIDAPVPARRAGGSVGGQRHPYGWRLDRQIARQCGRSVAQASWSINTSFPRFEGDDEANMIWVNEKGGPKLWLLY